MTGLDRPSLPTATDRTTGDFLLGGGEMGARMRAHDWSMSPLGPPETWPQSLRTVVNLLLNSKHPMFVAWGPSLAFLYNDGYAPILGVKHPAALGWPFKEVWAEIWADIQPLVARALSGEATWSENLHLVMERHGYPEDTWYTFSYSPVHDDNGNIAGMFCACTETTRQILAETARREAETAARESEARFRNMADTAPVMIWTTDASGSGTYLNRRWYEFTGQTEAEAVGFGWLDAIHPDDRPRTQAEFLEANAGLRPFCTEYRLRRADGVYRWAMDASSPRFDDDGTHLGYVGSVIDITERKMIEERYRTLAEALPQLVWTAMPDGGYSYLSRQWTEYTGIPQSEQLGLSWLDRVIHPDDRERTRQHWLGAVAGEHPYDIDYRIRRRDGVYRWFKVRGTPIFDETGSMFQWFGTATDIQDIVEARELQASLRQHLEKEVEQRTRERDRIWNASQDLLLVTDRAGVFLNVNRAWTATLGWSESALLGRTSEWLRHPDDEALTRAQTEHIAAGGRLQRFESRLRHKDGSYRWLSWTATLDQGLIYAVARDVTEEKAAAQALRQAEEALRQSQKMDAVGQLTGGIAHDFNNLLQVIGGNLQLLAKDMAGNARAEQRLHNAFEGVQRGSKLAAQLLAFGRRQPLQPKVVNLAPFLADMEDMLRRAAGEEIDLDVRAGADLWNVFVDPTQVENAVLNLVINARDAMDGHGKLTIIAANEVFDPAAAQARDVDPGEYVSLAVTDEGCGIPPDLLETVFEPFFTTKPEGQGTGLGLSMVYGFVKQSGGHVAIASTIGRGTTITMSLPRTFIPRQEAGDRDAQTDATIGGSETILVVEDDADVRTTVVEMLADLGYRVLQARDGRSALNIVEGGTAVDLLFTDVVMPGPLRSPDLAREATKLQPEMAVLFTSGYTKDAIVHDGRLDEGTHLLSKPYTKEALALKVRGVLDDRSRTRIEAPPGLRVLLVEDDALIRLSTNDALAEMGHRVAEAGSMAAALQRLGAAPVDVLVTDINLPDGSGADLALEARRRHAEIAVIFVSGQNLGAELRDDPRLAGAVFLQKPYFDMDLARAMHTVAERRGGPSAGF